MNNMRLNKKNQKTSLGEAGQGLLETVIALSIIITGLTAALALAVSNLSTTSDSGMRVIAGNLAREGAEAVRNIRDSNWLKGCTDPSNPEECFVWDSRLLAEDSVGDHTAILEFRKNPPPGEDNWILNFSPDSIDGEQAVLRLDGNIYNHASGSPSPFRRLITIDEICETGSSSCEDDICVQGEECPRDPVNTKIGIRVLSEVKWRERGREHSLIIEDRLFNWR